MVGSTGAPEPSSGAGLRVCIVSTHYAPETTGNAPYAASLAQGLAARGHTVTVLAGAPHYPGWVLRPPAEWQPLEEEGRLAVHRFASYVPSQPDFLHRLRYELGFGARFAGHLPPDSEVTILLSPSLFGAALVRLRYVLRRRRPALVLWMQDLYSAGMRETPGTVARVFAGVVRLIEATVARSVDRVVVIHDRFRDFVIQELGVAADRVAVVRNWTHVARPNGTDRESLRVRFGWAPGEIIALHAGNMGAKQGLENVVDAAQIAEARGLPVRFVLLGDGNQKARLVEKSAGCSRLEFVEPLPQEVFLDALSSADVLLVNERPSLNEAAVPSKLTSYFVTGNPVVAATDATSTTSDEIRASGAGVVVDPTDPVALVDEVLSVADRWGGEDRTRGPQFVARFLTEEAGIGRFADLVASLAAPRADEDEDDNAKEAAVA